MRWKFWRHKSGSTKKGDSTEPEGEKGDSAPLLEGREVDLRPEEKEKPPLERQSWKQRFNLKPTDIITYIGVGVASIYIIYSLALNIYNNYQTKKEIANAKNEILTLQIEKERLQSLLSYYNTKSYQEIELRRRLLLKKPGEIVVALNGANPLSEQDDTAEQTQTTKLPAIWQWYDYYFKAKD